MDPPLPMDGVLPPDLQGTLLRIGPAAGAGGGGGGGYGGALHAVELRDGVALSYVSTGSSADANVLWHAGSVLALGETGLPEQFSRTLSPEEFSGGLTAPIASHVHRDAATGGRILFGVEQGTETAAPFLRVGEWNRAGELTDYMAVELDRATWQHDLGVTARHLVIIESPTEYAEELAGPGGGGGIAGVVDDESTPPPSPVPYRWVPGAETWVTVVERRGDGSAPRWFRLDPCLVTHVLGAYDDGDAIVLYVCCYPAPEVGQPFDLASSVVGPLGIGQSLIGGGLAVLERWRIEGETLDRMQVDERMVEYPRVDPSCEGAPFRYGYCVEVAVGAGIGAAADRGAVGDVDHLGLLRFDLARDEVESWSPGQYKTASEPLFVRAVDGRSDDEGWLLTVVHDATRAVSDLYVLDASSLRSLRSPQAVIHLPAGLPFRAHGTWVGAELYR
jgi:carotenoid cleavage dioxygenase